MSSIIMYRHVLIRRASSIACMFVVLLVIGLPVALAETFDSPPPGNINWKVYDYNASGQAFRVRQPYKTTVGTDGGIAFDFLYTPDTALEITGHPSYRGDLLGDMTGKTISAMVGVTVTSGTPVFTYYGEGTPSNPCGTPANVRLFFQTQTPGPFVETDYWWSNPADADLQALTAVQDMQIANPMQGAFWSDYYGHFGTGIYADAFNAAVKNVKVIGLSFGGGCFFENGVGIQPGTGSAYFRLMDFSADPPGVIDLAAEVVPTFILAPFVVPTIIELP